MEIQVSPGASQNFSSNVGKITFKFRQTVTVSIFEFHPYKKSNSSNYIFSICLFSNFSFNFFDFFYLISTHNLMIKRH